MNSVAAILLFAYNRPQHLRQTIQALARNDLAAQSDLFVFSDAPGKPEHVADVEAVRAEIQVIQGFRSVQIVLRERNMGLAASLIDGISRVLETFERVVVVEDDLVTAPDFLSFINAGLDHYQDDPKVFSITGVNFSVRIPADYSYDAYLSYRASSWGWGTWRSRWRQADWSVASYNEFRKSRTAITRFNRGGDDLADMLAAQQAGRVNSWAIRWAYTHFQNDAYCVYPVESRVQNIGMDGSGTHSAVTNRYDAPIAEVRESHRYRFPVTSFLDPRIVKEFARIYAYPFRGKLKRAVLWRLRDYLSRFGYGERYIL